MRTRSKKVNRALAALTATCLLAGLSPVPQAYGEESVYELDQQIVAKQVEIDELNAELDKCQKRISELSVQMYKGTKASRTLSWVLKSEDFDSFVKNLDYANSAVLGYRREIDNLQRKVAEAQQSQSQVEELRRNKIEHIRQMEERRAQADYAHYAQGDPRWADVYYYGGNMAWTGCGLCSYASAVRVLNGNVADPPELLSMRGDWLGMDHYPDSTVGTPDGSTHRELTQNLFGLDSYNIGADELLLDISDVNAAAVVLLKGAVKRKDGSWWYTDGHYVCAYAYEDGSLHVHDPAGSGDEGQDVVYSGNEINQFTEAISSIVLYRK